MVVRSFLNFEFSAAILFRSIRTIARNVVCVLAWCLMGWLWDFNLSFCDHKSKLNWIFSPPKEKFGWTRKPHPMWVRFDVTTKQNWIFAGTKSTSKLTTTDNRKHRLKRDIRVSASVLYICYFVFFVIVDIVQHIDIATTFILCGVCASWYVCCPKEII